MGAERDFDVNETANDHTAAHAPEAGGVPALGRQQRLQAVKEHGFVALGQEWRVLLDGSKALTGMVNRQPQGKLN